MEQIEKEVQKALSEIGEIKPWFSKEDGLFVFEHASYPAVFHADGTEKDTVDGYLRALRGFIEERLEGNVASYIDEATSGRGGYRPGAGRKKGSKKEPTKQIRLPVDIADWLKADQENIVLVREVMEQHAQFYERMKEAISENIKSRGQEPKGKVFVGYRILGGKRSSKKKKTKGQRVLPRLRFHKRGENQQSHGPA